MSGAAIANVVGTGTFTIPMIKKRGFPPALCRWHRGNRFIRRTDRTTNHGSGRIPDGRDHRHTLRYRRRGGVGPGGFLLFEPIHICGDRSAPGRASRSQDRSEIPKLGRQDAISSLTFVGPILVIIAALATGYSAAFAGFAGIIAAIVLSVLNPEVRRDPMRIIRSFEEGGISAAKLMVAVTLIGMIIGVVNMTGVGLRFAGLIEELGGGALYLSLVLTMLGTIILGMGMPTLPAYLIVIVIMGPAFQRMGVEVLVIHMFVLYYARRVVDYATGRTGRLRGGGNRQGQPDHHVSHGNPPGRGQVLAAVHLRHLSQPAAGR